MQDADRIRRNLEHYEAALQRLEAGADAPEAFGEADERLRALEREAAEGGHTLPLVDLRARYALRDLDLHLLLLALRPQLIARQGTPLTVGELLARYYPEPAWRGLAIAALGSNSVLGRHRFVSLWGSEGTLGGDSLALSLLAPPWLAAFVLGAPDLGTSLSRLARFTRPSGQPEALGDQEALDRLRPLINAWQRGPSPLPLCLGLCGDRGSGKSTLARRLAAEFEAPMIEVDGAFVAGLDARTGVWGFREVYAAAELYGAWVCVDTAQALQPKSGACEELARCMERPGGLSLLLSSELLAEETGLPQRLTRRDLLGRPSDLRRRELWRRELGEGLKLLDDEEGSLNHLAARFELSTAQLRNAAWGWTLAQRGAETERTEDPLRSLEDAAGGQLRGDPGNLVRTRGSKLSLDDIILPRDELDMVREILAACRNHFALLHRWGFRQRLSYGTGIVCLFSGDPGTGKTLTARVMAAELGRDLFQVSLPDMLSKWVGETEKQIARLFHEAKASQAILLFDEADSLLSARTEVQSSSDRYANIATNHLLQEIEAFEGIVLLTTNLEQNLDSAAARRILFRLHFPFPDQASRALLWQHLIPPQAKLGRDVDFGELGELFELPGGHIKNAIVRAAYEALDLRRSIDMECLLRAGAKECRALGKLVREEALLPRKKKRRRSTERKTSTKKKTKAKPPTTRKSSGSRR